ncbi:hypothetical protein, partial [Klebsiella pneumoniae]|uniref:hypothetical protein n=1 Tax=Klebsiella pneumoniae TaxID=573 RepID=UPI003013B80A
YKYLVEHTDELESQGQLLITQAHWQGEHGLRQDQKFIRSVRRQINYEAKKAKMGVRDYVEHLYTINSQEAIRARMKGVLERIRDI